MSTRRINIPCFFMLCTDHTENECIEKGLFGDKEWRLQHLKSIDRGHIGFLLNITRDEILGIFVAEGPAQLNIEPDAWRGGFPAQVKVKLIGKIKRITKASEKLQQFLELTKIPKEPYPYKVPAKNTYGPEITEKVLSLFQTTPEEINILSSESEEIGTIPQYTLQDIAGLKEVKDFIYQRIIAPFEDEEAAYALNLRVGGGMLLFGPPGTGKTLVAMAVAKSIQAKFVDVSPSVIIGYPGEAEKRLENIFSALEKEPRAVVFVDEAEWILSRREDQASSVMQRITPLLLALLSRIFKERTKPIIVIAATNKPEMIDPAFLRPGRFDKVFYVGLPDKDSRAEIIKHQLRNRAHALNNDEINELAEKLEGYSGADITNIIDEASFIAFSRRSSGDVQIIINDIIEAIEKTPKSVTSEDVQKIENWAKTRGITID